MKLSVSLSREDVEVLDEHARRTGLRSRSAAIQDAIRLLKQAGLHQEYADAWAEWDSSGDREAWEQTINDGLADASR